MPSKRAAPRAKLPEEGRRRVRIEGVWPDIDNGRFAAKRVVGESVDVSCHLIADGHDKLAGVVRYRHSSDEAAREVRLADAGYGRYTASFVVDRPGAWTYSVSAWIDRFGGWQRDLAKRVDAGQDVSLELRIGAELVKAAGVRAPELEDARASMEQRITAALAPELAELMRQHDPRLFATELDHEARLWVDRERARFSSWYELFPRSASDVPGRHGTFADVEKRLPYIAELGFDVLYLPPIHPIGRAHRKGKNNAVSAAPGEPGSPWAIGAAEGGHKAVHPELGTLADFRRLVQRAGEQGIEIALDLALQCSPEHPYVKEHPEWFRRRPDGSIQYAENPPKKYQDIYPFDFESEAWRELWKELASIVFFWIEQGVKIFRVDNPHTKALDFWEWLIAEVRREHPEVLFLSEAFTERKMMYALAKLGFTQSYTYFTWRNYRDELADYFRELTSPPVVDFFRPNLWPNTPDILHAFLQSGGPAAFAIRAVLASTLGASWGIYGPAFELSVATPREPGSEEYLDSEKYELRSWNLGAGSHAPLIAKLNRIRRDNPALQRDRSLHFHGTDNDRLIAFSKRSADGSNTILTVVNLDPKWKQAAWIDLWLDGLGLAHDRPFAAHDLLTGASFRWQGWRNFVELDPTLPAHVLRIEQL